MSDPFNPQAIIALALGFYLFAEGVVAIMKMTPSDQPLHFTKYFFTALVGMWMCIDAVMAEVDWLAIAQGAALASFIARRLLWRLGHKSTDVRQAKT